MQGTYKRKVHAMLKPDRRGVPAYCLMMEGILKYDWKIIINVMFFTFAGKELNLTPVHLFTCLLTGWKEIDNIDKMVRGLSY